MDKPQRRVASPRGASYFDTNRGVVMRMGDDVTGIKQQIEERWPALEFGVDIQNEEFFVVEHCDDGEDRLVFAQKDLYGFVERVERSQQPLDVDQFLDNLDKEQAKAEAARDYDFSQKLGDAGERLFHALKKDDIGGIPSIYFKDPGDRGSISSQDGTEKVRLRRHGPVDDVA